MITSVIRYCRALDTSATDGRGKTALAFGDFTAKYLTQGGVLTSLTTQTITTLGTWSAPTDAAHIRIKELAASDPTKGIYEIQFHNTQVAPAGQRLWLFLSAAGAAIDPLEIDLCGYTALDSAGVAATVVLLGTPVDGTVSRDIADLAATVNQDDAWLNIIYDSSIVFDTLNVMSATSNTITTTSGNTVVPTDGARVGELITVRGATPNLKQTRMITASVHATGVMTVDRPWDTVPTNSWQATIKTADQVSAATIAAAVWAFVVSGTMTALQYLRLAGAMLFGKRSNVGTTSEQYDDPAAPGTARVVANLDGSGNGTPTLTP